MSKQKKRTWTILIGIGALVVIIFLFLFIFAEVIFPPSSTEKEYERIDTIANKVDLPPQLSLQSKTKMYDALSSIEGAGWDYRYSSSIDARQTCAQIRQSLINADYVILSKTCIDYPSGIYEVHAKSEDKNLIIYSRIEGSKDSTIRIEWSRLHRYEGAAHE